MTVALELRPAHFLWNSEDIFARVFVRVFGAVRVVGRQLGELGLEAVGDVHEEEMNLSTWLKTDKPDHRHNIVDMEKTAQK